MQNQDPRTRRRAAFSATPFRSSVRDSIAQRDPALWNRARMLIRSTTNRYVNSEHPMDVTEIDLHDLWYLIIEISKITPVKDAAADQLVAQVIVARQLGQLRRLVAAESSGKHDIIETERDRVVEDAVTSSGERMWCDLPFLVADLRATWTQTMDNMSTSEREGLANICARLSATGVCEPHVTSCALILLREALETPRSILDTASLALPPDNNNTSARPLVDFLPAVLIWLWHGSFQILRLCAQDHVPSAADDVELGWVAVGSLVGVEGQCASGFNMQRWYFWKSRLEEVRNCPSNAEVAEQGRQCVQIMESWEEIIGGRSHERGLARNAFFRARHSDNGVI
nr:hypothetical protein CFP56_25956 [Quercus suber]